MNKLLVFLFAFLSFSYLQGQETAFDWTRTECGSDKEHHLFAELDSGYVVVIDLVMMNCLPCVTASNGLIAILSPYEETHPGKVRFYSVGFHNSITCNQILDWKIFNGFKHTAFANGGEETAYYGGMGMPTIVVLGGGSAHKVYYSDFGYAPSYDPTIQAAIDAAIEESHVTGGLDPNAGKNQFHVFPNPVSENVSIDLMESKATELIVRDMTGREWYRQPIDSGNYANIISLSTREWPKGILLFGIYAQGQLIGLQKLIIM